MRLFENIGKTTDEMFAALLHEETGNYVSFTPQDENGFIGKTPKEKVALFVSRQGIKSLPILTTSVKSYYGVNKLGLPKEITSSYIPLRVAIIAQETVSKLTNK